MNLDYKILWVEDDKSWYATTLELFSDILEDLGFKLESKKCENIEEVKAEISLNNLKEYDMLLVDFTLKNSDSGDKIIEFIRSIKDEPILTDVLFYSSAVENVRDSMHQLGLEGVYTADRKEIEIKFELVLMTTIKKVQDLNNIRGLVMSETSELDNFIEEIIFAVLSKENDEADKLKVYIIDSIKSSTQGNSKKAEMFNELAATEMVKSRLFDADKKSRTINKILNLFNIKDKQFDGFYENYKTDVLEIRNHLAHAKSGKIEGVECLIISGNNDDNPLIINHEQCIQIRKNLRKHSELLKTIRDITLN